MKRRVRPFQREHIGLFEATISELFFGGTDAGTRQLFGGAVDAGDAQLGEARRQMAGVKTRPAPDLQQARLRRRRRIERPQVPGDLFGVVAKEMLATESIEPMETFE